MKWELIVKPSAEIDIDEAFVWYEEARENLGFEFLLSLDATFEALKRNPQFAGILYDEVRSTSLTRFPFAVIYLIEDYQIIILAVLHHSRSPEEWKKRLSG